MLNDVGNKVALALRVIRFIIPAPGKYKIVRIKLISETSTINDFYSFDPKEHIIIIKDALSLFFEDQAYSEFRLEAFNNKKGMCTNEIPTHLLAPNFKIFVTFKKSAFE